MSDRSDRLRTAGPPWTGDRPRRRATTAALSPPEYHIWYWWS